jgi:hypothetical protein
MTSWYIFRSKMMELRHAIESGGLGEIETMFDFAWGKMETFERAMKEADQ